MIDTHAHVHDRAFDDDREPMLARAREAGVEAIVTVGCDADDSRRACETAERYGLLATVGIHPHEAKDAPADLPAVFDGLRERFGDRIVAVGETGLDYHYDHSPREVQRDVFARQLSTRGHDASRSSSTSARRTTTSSPACAPDTIRATQRGIVHCFTGTAGEARLFAGELGLLLGIGGVAHLQDRRRFARGGRSGRARRARPGDRLSVPRPGAAPRQAQRGRLRRGDRSRARGAVRRRCSRGRRADGRQRAPRFGLAAVATG